MASMKLGSKADAFKKQGQAWFCTTGLPSDIVVEVDDMSFHLHKFPLLSRSGVMEKLIAEATEKTDKICTITVNNIPGGPTTFELVAKFCYGVKHEITASNVVHLRCAAEFLEMTEEYGEDNLISQTEMFFNQVVLKNWKDSLKSLQTCVDVLEHAEELNITKRCIDSLAVKASTDPNLFGWPVVDHGGPIQSPGGSVLWNGISTGARPKKVSSDWWYEDSSCLSLPLYKRLILAMEARGIKQEITAGSVACYARKYLPGLTRRKSAPAGGSGEPLPEENKDLLVDLAIGNLLPDEDELLDGVIDGFDLNNRANELEEYDLFGSGGGMELESDMDYLNLGISKASLGDVGNGSTHYNIANGVGNVAGEHPYGEHPSRTLFVRNINGNVEDSELRTLFEQFGDIRTLYTACKNRGFVMISYYDIRAARTAMRALQNKPLRRRKLDIHYSIPKGNSSDKDINEGSLVVFNLDPSVSYEDLLQIFGVYGEVKEIRETPHKRQHKIIEYYDVRVAETALRSVNRSDIAGKHIKLGPSHPGGPSRNLMLQLGQAFDQDDARTFCLQLGPAIASSPPRKSAWPQFGSPIEHSPLQSLSKSPVLGPTFSNNLPGLASIIKDHQRANGPTSHSLPDSKLSPISSFGGLSSGIETLSGPQFLWGSPNDQSKAPSHGFPVTGRSPTMAHPFTTSKGPTHGFPIMGRHGSLLGPSQHHHHVGSAPSGIPFKGHFGHFHEPSETMFMSPPAFGLGLTERRFLGSRGSVENGSPSFSTMSSSPRISPMFLGNAHLGPTIAESLTERGRNRRVDQNGSQTDSKKQFQLDLDKIRSGEDARTTLMIKNIPNKYTSKMLLAAIDVNHSGTYDFLYLPIDFKNKCNVGYAFINMLSPTHIIPFYQAFNGKKWEKFNSEKVACLAYARIQGKTALMTHFQNSSLMNEDKRYRPILFHSDQKPLSANSLNIQMYRSNGSDSGDSSGSPPKDGAVEHC